MELELFHFIEDTLTVYDAHQPLYQKAEEDLKNVFSEIVASSSHDVIALHTRVKSRDSLREKLLRNKYYLHFSSPEDALKNMHDLIGITIECRFIRSEAEIYQNLFHWFEVNGNMFSCIQHPEVKLNLRMVQPQLQRNGYTIYRIDGSIMEAEGPIAFELQIKSLVHRFWSEIEHEIVYKNNELIVNDSFVQQMLGSVRDSLDVVDHQMDILYTKLSDTSSQASIGMNEHSFKLLVATSINELVNAKMKDSIGYTSDFRKDASILSQYIYIRYFLNGEHNETRMVEFLEYLNELNARGIDFRSALPLDELPSSGNVLEQRLITYWLSKINSDYEWHAFFTVLFNIQTGSLKEDVQDFAHVIALLLVQPGWYASLFTQFGKEEADRVRNSLLERLADALIRADTIDTIHDEKLYEVKELFRHEADRISAMYSDYALLSARLEDLGSDLSDAVLRLFQV